MLERMWESTSYYFLVGKQIGSAVLKSVWRTHKKQKVDLPLLGICPKDMTSHYTDTCSAMAIAALLTIARNWKQPQFF